MKKFYLVLLLVLIFVLSGCESSNSKTVPIFLDMELVGEKNDDSEIIETKDNEALLEEEMIVREASLLFGDLSQITDHYDFYFKLRENSVFALIAIHLSNPDNLEIDRIVINGQNFRSNKYQEGSNSEMIILELQLDVSGTDNLTLNWIEYVDNDDLIRIDIEENKIFEYGVQYEPVTLSYNSYTFTTSPNSFNHEEEGLGLNDPQQLIEDEENVKVLLFEGDSIVQYRNFTGSLSFEELTPGTKYLIVIVAAYDLGDGEGEVVHILKKIEFTTKE